MKLTYRALLESREILASLLELKPAPTARIAAQIARNIRLVSRALEDFESAKSVLLKPFIKNQQLEIPKEETTRVEGEFEELLDTEVEIDVHPLRLSDIEHLEEVKPGFEIPVNTFYVLDWMFE